MQGVKCRPPAPRNPGHLIDFNQISTTERTEITKIPTDKNGATGRRVHFAHQKHTAANEHFHQKPRVFAISIVIYGAWKAPCLADEIMLSPPLPTRHPCHSLNEWMQQANRRKIMSSQERGEPE
jgi:hypothetical protein